jgi:hypothetical protein
MLKAPSFVIKLIPHIRKLSESLRKLGVCLFNHDITFGEGRIVILADNEDFLNFYYKNEHPAIFTDITGRILDPNIYLHSYLNENYGDYRRITSSVYNKFNFKSSIHIAENEEDC